MNAARLMAGSVVLVFSCGRQSPERAYQSALQAWRNGNSTEGLALTRTLKSSCPPVSECRLKARLLEAEILLYDNQLAPAASILAENMPDNAPALRARRNMLEGAIQVVGGDLNAAEDSLRVAQQLASSSGAWDVLLDAETWNGRLLYLLKRPGPAEDVFRHAADEAAGRQDAYREAIALNGLNMIRLLENRFDEAIPGFIRIVQSAERGGLQRILSIASTNLGICYSNLGNFDEARSCLRRGIDLLGESGLTSYRMNLLGEIGNTYLRQGDANQAVPFYQKAVALARNNQDAALWNRNLASAFVETADWDAAERSNRVAASLGKDSASTAKILSTSAAIAAGKMRYGEACELYSEAIRIGEKNPAVLWESHAGLAETYTTMGDHPAANREFAKALEVIDKSGASVSSADNKLTFFAALNGFYQNYVRALVRRHANQKALEVADSSRARILAERLSLGRMPPGSAVRDYRAIARQTGGALLFYFLSPGESYLWVITPAKTYAPIVLPPAGQIQRWVDDYRKFVEQRVGDPMTYESQAGRHLYENLVAPAAALVPRGSRVVLVPDGALHWLNFETLPVYSNSSAVPPHYWIEDVRLVVAPSLAVLATSEQSKPLAPNSLLLIGDPVSPSPEFPPLSYASQEIARIRQHFPGSSQDTFVGLRARPATYQESRPGRFALLHFSAHGVANQQSPLDSAIILSKDGDNFKLYARNIIPIHLQADLVTISACRSAGARSYSGEGLVGFVWAFLQAGARSVIAGLWDVTDSSTPGIMDLLYSQIKDGHRPADALRQAKLELIRSTGNYRKPYYWGPFQLYTR
jgi:CHAT domain-containing protein/tetratricopeptide (TPR) repeat protein